MRPPTGGKFMKPFAHFDRNTGTLRFETLRDMRNARIGEQREIPLFTYADIEELQQQIRKLERKNAKVDGIELQ